MAGYQDEFLQQEMLHKSLFWGNPSYYGVNLQPLYQDASAANFKQVWGVGVVVGWAGGCLLRIGVCL